MRGRHNLQPTMLASVDMAAGSWAWWRWKRSRSRVEEPILTGISHIGSLQAQGAAQTRW